MVSHPQGAEIAFRIGITLSPYDHLTTSVRDEESLGDNPDGTSLKVRRFDIRGGVHSFAGTGLPNYSSFAFSV